MGSRLATSFALFGLILALAMAAGADGAGVASRSALSAKVPTTVYDPVLHVSWLADANLPARMKFGLAINKDGSMSYQTAVQWVRRLNRHHFLGHGDWTLPITPTPYRDMGCSGRNKKGGGSFGLGCSQSPLAWVYTRELGLRWPDTAVAIPDTTTGPFHDFQPYLYWTGTPAQTAGGFQTFSFNTGWSGSNQTDHFMYVLPMLAGNPFVGTATSGLQSVDGGQAVWEPGAGPAGAGDHVARRCRPGPTDHLSLSDMFGTDGSMAGKAVTLKGKTVGGTAATGCNAEDQPLARRAGMEPADAAGARRAVHGARPHLPGAGRACSRDARARVSEHPALPLLVMRRQDNHRSLPRRAESEQPAMELLFRQWLLGDRCHPERPVRDRLLPYANPAADPPLPAAEAGQPSRCT